MTAQPFAKTPQRQREKKKKTLQRSKGQNTKQPKESFEGIKSVPLKTSQINQRVPRKELSLSHLSRSQIYRKYYLKNVCSCGFCLMNLILLKSIKAQRVLEKTVSRELLSAWTEKDRVDNKIKMSVSQFFFFFFQEGT